MKRLVLILGLLLVVASLALLSACSGKKACVGELSVTTVDGKRDTTFEWRDENRLKWTVRYKLSGDSVTVWEEVYHNYDKLDRTYESSINGVSKVVCETKPQYNDVVRPGVSAESYCAMEGGRRCLRRLNGGVCNTKKECRLFPGNVYKPDIISVRDIRCDGDPEGALTIPISTTGCVYIGP